MRKTRITLMFSVLPDADGGKGCRYREGVKFKSESRPCLEQMPSFISNISLKYDSQLD